MFLRRDKMLLEVPLRTLTGSAADNRTQVQSVNRSGFEEILESKRINPTQKIQTLLLKSRNRFEVLLVFLLL